MKNSLGQMFTISSFGESHGSCVGITIDGCPAGLSLTEADVQKQVDRRRPGKIPGTTARAEDDQVEIISGTFNGKTTGAPLTLVVWNKDKDSSAYSKIRLTPRPGHADYTAMMKSGGFNDFRGGGRFSGRITVGFVMAGAVARKVLDQLGVEIIAHTVEIAGIRADRVTLKDLKKNVEISPLKCADPAAALEMLSAIENAQAEGDSVGGVVEGIAFNVPVGLGEPIFDTLEGDMAKAIFAIPAVKGVEFGAGFEAARKKGSENNDPFAIKKGKIITLSDNAGGILGGISDGMPIVLRAAVKPPPSISRTQQTIDLKRLKNTKMEIRGRHDACIVPRAVPIVESMMAVTLCDFAIRARLIPEVLK